MKRNTENSEKRDNIKGKKKKTKKERKKNVGSEAGNTNRRGENETEER